MDRVWNIVETRISGLIPGGKRKIYDAGKGLLKNLTAEGEKYCDLRGIFCRHCEEESPSVIVIVGSLKNIHLLINLTGTTRPDFFGKQSLSDGVAAYQEFA